MIQISAPCTQGITKFQALYRGYSTRKYTVVPNSVLSALVCDRVNSFIQSNRRLATDASSEIIEGGKFFIKWDKKQEELSLLFPREDLVGSGAWKKFFSSNSIKIPISAKKRDIEQFESVWTEVDGKTIDEISIPKVLYEQFIKEKPIGVYFLEPLKLIHQNIYTQKRLTNKLESTQFNNPSQKSYCIRDIARTLIWMHQQRVAHGDVHLKNVLVEERTDDEGLFRLIPYLTDFGSTKIWGANQTRKLDDYVRWDCCKCFADINTPLMDWHGFIVTNIVTWFPKMAACLKWEKFILARQMVFDSECRGQSIPDDFYWTSSPSFASLTPLEQRAWHLFIAVCKKSTQLYLQFKNNAGEISKEEVEMGLIEVNALELLRQCLQFVEDMCDNSALDSKY